MNAEVIIFGSAIKYFLRVPGNVNIAVLKTNTNKICTHNDFGVINYWKITKAEIQFENENDFMMHFIVVSVIVTRLHE